MKTIRNILLLITLAPLALATSFIAGKYVQQSQMRAMLIQHKVARYNPTTAAFELLSLQDIAALPEAYTPLPVAEPISVPESLPVMPRSAVAKRNHK